MYNYTHFYQSELDYAPKPRSEYRCDFFQITGELTAARPFSLFLSF